MKLDLKAIEERCEKATPGPWRVEPRYSGFFNFLPTGGNLGLKEQTNALYLKEENQNGDHLGADIQGPVVPSRSTFAVRDAWFIANARTDVPVLLECVKELREALRTYALNVGPIADNARELLTKWFGDK